LPLVVRARTFDPGNPAVREVVARLSVDVDDELPRVDASRWIDAVDAIEGWLTRGEAELLARCVAGAPADGTSAIVEIGSYKGRSTLLLALAASELGRGTTVVAIDPHTGYHFGNGADTYDALVSALEAAGVTSVVDVRRERSADAELELPIALGFVDGLHDADSVREDRTQIARRLVPGGLVAFHDYTESFPGVVEAVNELLAGDEYELAGWRESLVVLRKVSGEAGRASAADAAGAVAVAAASR
jgi:predicted O-methyltransferase YrrM